MYVILILLLAGCETEETNNKFSGEYNGYWAETIWQYKFYANNEFEFKCEGHYGFVESRGTYEKKQDSLFLIPLDSSLIKQGVVNSLYIIDGDSCIIDYKLKYDYCKTREWSQHRQIKYPQIKTSNSGLVSEVEFMLQDALESKQLKEQIKDTSTNLIIENYYELNGSYGNQLEVFGQPVAYKSKHDIESEGIKNYVQITDVNYNKTFTSFTINVIPIKPGTTILAYYYKEDGKWKRRKP